MKRGLFLFFVFCAISNAYAQMDCESIPSCEELGYTQDSCSGGKGVRCPFDENKFYCAGVKQLPDAPEPVITPEDWTAGCADKIAYCTAYNNDCQCTACESGYLLSDGVCVSACDKSVDICAAESKIFNSANCTCEACPSGYLFDNEVNECREACKEDVNNCVEYDSEWADCQCTACKDNWFLSSLPAPGGYCAHDFCDVWRNGSLSGSGDCSVTYCRKCDSTQSGVCDQCADGFTLENNKCIPPTGRCIEGSVLYDDFNCYDPENAPADRTAIGIVYAARPKSVDVAPNNLYAISLSYTALPWSENLANTETGCNSYTDGQANTDCIIAAGAEENSAAVYCSKYGVTDADKGKWFLPAVHQLKNEQIFMCLIRNAIFAITGTGIRLTQESGLPAVNIYATFASIATSTEYKYKPVLYNTVISPSGYWDHGDSFWNRENKSQTKQTVYCIIDFKKYQ